MELVLGLEPWLGYLIIAVCLTYLLVMGGWALARAGRSPLWVLLLLVPWVNLAAIWVFAYIRWPAEDMDQDRKSGTD
jgi:hypothetical protein